MSSQSPFGRLLPAMVTPFDDYLELDIDRAQELAIRLLDGGCDSLVICATTGEAPTLSVSEKMDVIRAVVSAVDGRAPIVVNCGGNCTSDSISFAKSVNKLGVDGIMLVTPYYNKPPQEGLYRHFSAIAGVVDVPVILYNIPGRCVINMQAETTLRLANDVENIVAIKEASGDLMQVKNIIDNAPSGFFVYSGDDELTLPILELGGEGVISTIANVAPQRMKKIIDLYVDGDVEMAREANARLQPLMSELFVTSNPIMIKRALEIAGFPVGGLRLPLVEATDEQTASLENIMREVGVID